MSSKKLVVFYHADCMDGYAAACAFKLNYSGPEPFYKKSSYGFVNKLNTGIADKLLNDTVTHLVFLDICPDYDNLKYLADQGFKILVLDHHATAKDTLFKGIDNVGYVMADNLSGASLVYSVGKNIATLLDAKVKAGTFLEPILVEHVTLSSNLDVEPIDIINPTACMHNRLYKLLEVRDIWDTTDPKRKLDADYLAAYFKHHNTANNKVAIIGSIFDMDLDAALAEGKLIYDVQESLLRNVMRNCYTSSILTGDGKPVELLIGQCPDGMGSMFGDIWNEQHESSIVIALYFNFRANMIGISVRSNNGMSRYIGERLGGGGGHDNASGAMINTAKEFFSINTFITTVESWIYDYRKGGK